jgi:hypothetical protein
MSKPKACPGTYHWLLCRNCSEKVACGLRSVVASTFAHGRREEVVAP